MNVGTTVTWYSKGDFSLSRSVDNYLKKAVGLSNKDLQKIRNAYLQ